MIFFRKDSKNGGCKSRLLVSKTSVAVFGAFYVTILWFRAEFGRSIIGSGNLLTKTGIDNKIFSHPFGDSFAIRF